MDDEGLSKSVHPQRPVQNIHIHGMRLALP